MRTKVNTETVNVNEVGNIVNCTLKTTIDLSKIKAYNVIKDTAGWKAFLRRWPFSVNDDVVIITTTGSAACNKDAGDKFDSRFGKELAELRGQNETLIIVNKLYNKIESLAINELLYHDICMLSENVQRCRKDVKRYLKSKINE